MKRLIVHAGAAGLLVLSAGCAPTGDVQPVTGGYVSAPVTQAEVVAAAAFAVEAVEAELRKGKSPSSAGLELVSVLSARQQVVAGVNHELTLRVRLNGVERSLAAVVWWQAWRSPAPYQLTSWRWM